MVLQVSQNNQVKIVVKVCWLVTWCLLAGLFVGIRPLQAADAVVGTGSPASCTEGTFDAALSTVQNSGGGTITFNCGPSIHFIEFFAGSTGKIINTPVVINAANKIVLNAYNERRHFYVASNGSLTLQNITLVQGRSNTDNGGSIHNLGTLILEGAIILDSNVGADYSGGAIVSNGGPVTITNSRLENNTGGNGGGLYLVGETADATITNSIFRNNRTTNATFGFGGAIEVTSGADVIIRNSTLERNQALWGGAIDSPSVATSITIEAFSKLLTNTATLGGGGIYISGTLTLSNSTIAGNTAAEGGGIRNDGGSVTLVNSTVVSNTGTTDGGGIYNKDGSVILNNSTVAGNTAPFGGGVRNNGGSVTLTNSTIAANTATNQGGGIYNFGAFALTNGTVAGNTAATGGGIYNVLASSVVTLTNSIVANSLNGQDCSSTGTIVSQGYNLDNDNTCHLTATSDITNTNPLLGPLQANGGATLTRGLLVGSPAIDPIPNGANGCGSTIASDQRGVVRPQGPGCDIGAFEVVYVNHSPLANAQTVTTTVNTARAITLTGSDADNDGLTYTITISPLNGTLSGTAPNLTYTPNIGFHGNDSFSFRVNDGTVASDPAVVTILVEEQGSSNQPPLANAQTVTTTVNTAKAITLTASDADNDVLTYTVTISPLNGTLSGTAPNLTYTPNTGFHGNDSFTFRVNDGTVASDPAVVTILVEEQGNTNHAPVANGQTVTTTVNTARAITLTASDADNDVLTYTLTSNPLSGTLSGTSPNLTYTPNTGFHGNDSFTFRVNDGTVASDPAVVTILVEEQGNTNHAPLANGQTVTTTINTARAITLTASDADNDVLTYTVIISPTHGTLSGTSPNLTYTPNAGFSGNDSFTFRVNDGTVASDPAVVTILVEEQGSSNHPPMAVADAVTITAGVTVTINVLTNDVDPDGDVLTVTINQQPQHGSAVVKGGAIVYTPSANFSGSDSLSYTITDSKGATANATISITVKPQASRATIYLPLVSKQ